MRPKPSMRPHAIQAILEQPVPIKSGKAAGNNDYGFVGG
jgi:hypothetical protein